MRSAFRSPVTSQGPPPRPRPASPEPRLAGSRPLRPAPSRHLPRLPSPGLRVGRGLCLVSGTTPGSITGSRVCHLRCDRCPPAVNVTCALSSLAGLRARRLEHSLPGLTWGSCTLRAGVCVHVCVQVCVHLSLSPPQPQSSLATCVCLGLQRFSLGAHWALRIPPSLRMAGTSQATRPCFSSRGHGPLFPDVQSLGNSCFDGFCGFLHQAGGPERESRLRLYAVWCHPP